MKVSGVDIFLFIRILFVCDMGSSTDDLFALMMLYRYMDMGRCNLLGVMIDRMGGRQRRRGGRAEQLLRLA